MEILKDLALLVARICISSLFIWAAIEKMIHWRDTVVSIEKRELPYASLGLPLVLAIQILGGLSILLGYHVQVGALILILYIIPAAILFHNFWKYEETERLTEKIYFMKDVAIFGSLLLLLVFGGGRFGMN